MLKFYVLFLLSLLSLVACGSPETTQTQEEGETHLHESATQPAPMLVENDADEDDSSVDPSLTNTVDDEVENRATWKKANLTHFTSYPNPGSEECLKYNGCQWAGMFAALPSKKSENWVKSHNIIAVHSRHFGKYRMKTLRLRSGSNTIDAKVYDQCSDSDCNGCCTKNSQSTGFLIDIEKYSMQRFGKGSGVVEWRCLDCG